MKTLTKDQLLVAPRKELIDQINALSNHATELSVQLEWFKRQVFGTKSERFIPDDVLQTALDLGVIENKNLPKENKQQTITYNKQTEKQPVKGHGRGSMPTHLPIKDVVIEPKVDTTGMEKIGEEVSWYYEMDTPSSLHIVREITPKYARLDGSGVVKAPFPERAVEKGNAGAGFIAHLTNEKYVYHMPLDRLRKKFYSEYKVEFSESWLCDCIKNGVYWYSMVYDEYVKKLLQSSYLQVDETPFPVLTKDGKGKTHRGYMWVYYDPIQKITIFDYRKSRSKDGPIAFLKDFKGTLQIDGYEGCNEIITTNGLIRASCMDHVRRYFERSLEYDVKNAIHAIDTMRYWYHLEREARDGNYSFEQRLAMRKEKIAGPMNELKNWMKKLLPEVLPKSPIGIALQYALNQWDFFNPYLNDGRIELSNILIENAIRPLAIGRKNYQFAGSHDAAKYPAVIYSLTSISKSNNVEPVEHFKELLTELPKISTKDISKFLLPKAASSQNTDTSK